LVVVVEEDAYGVELFIMLLFIFKRLGLCKVIIFIFNEEMEYVERLQETKERESKSGAYVRVGTARKLLFVLVSLLTDCTYLVVLSYVAVGLSDRLIVTLYCDCTYFQYYRSKFSSFWSGGRIICFSARASRDIYHK
jgi:hypothetical protein